MVLYEPVDAKIRKINSGTASASLQASLSTSTDLPFSKVRPCPQYATTSKHFDGDAGALSSGQGKNCVTWVTLPLSLLTQDNKDSLHVELDL